MQQCLEVVVVSTEHNNTFPEGRGFDWRRSDFWTRRLILLADLVKTDTGQVIKDRFGFYSDTESVYVTNHIERVKMDWPSCTVYGNLVEPDAIRRFRAFLKLQISYHSAERPW